MAAITKLLSLQAGVPRAIQTGDTVAASGAWTFAENAVFNAPVLFNGGATGIISENVLVKDPYTVHASDYQVDADRSAGSVYVTRGSATFSITSVASNKFLTSTDPSAAFAAGDFISIASPANPLNLGIYEVASVDSAGVTIKTSPDASVAGIVSQAATDSGAGGTLAKARLSIFQAAADGTEMRVAYGSASPLAFTKLLEDGDVSMQSAYDGGAATTLSGGVPISWALSAGGNDFAIDGAGSMLVGQNTELTAVSVAAVDFTAAASNQLSLTSGSTALTATPSYFTAFSSLIALASDQVSLTDGLGSPIYSYVATEGKAKQEKYLEVGMAGQAGTIWAPAGGYAPVVGDVVCMSDGAETIRAADADTALQSRPVGVVVAQLPDLSWFVATGHGQRIDVTFDAAVSSAAIGKVAYLSATAATATLTPPESAGTHIVELGVVVAAPGGSVGRILFAPRYVAAN